MTTEEKLQHFTTYTMDEARKNCDLAIREYKDALEHIFQEHQEAKRRQEELEIKTETERLIRENNQRFSQDSGNDQGDFEPETGELRDKLFVEVRDMLARYFETSEYHRQLVKELKKAIAFARGEEVILYVDPSDAERVPSLQVEVGAPITVSRYSFIGGTRAVIPGRHILIDNSFESKLAKAKENFRIKGGKAVNRTGVIYGINGPVVYIKGSTEFKMAEMVYVGNERLVGEVIGLEKDLTTIQVYEETTGIKPGELVEASGDAISVTLAPGILNNIFDGIERPLSEIAKTGGAYISRGTVVDALDREKLWDAHMVVEEGAHVSGGQIICEVPETSAIVHKVMVPPDLEGIITKVVPDGKYTINDTLAVLQLADGSERELTMMQKWPIRVPRPIQQRYPAMKPLITGQRILDTLFPIAKGGTAAVPGGFGTGKTMTQHQIAKWSDADIIIYIGCGERGNEMTQVLEDFSKLVDPKSGNPLMDRTALIANTSNMPVAAREASIYTGVTLAEYYRDMGYDVAIMADSTSRWAEALRELSGRLEEMPAEEGFPAYLASRLSAFYERAGMMMNLNGTEGSVSIIGAVSPQGGDFSEPVTQNTKRFVRCFWGLDKSLAYARHFPAIHWLTSYSEYISDLAPWYKDHVSREFMDCRNRLIVILNQESSLMEIVKLIGSDVLPDDQKLVLEISRVIRLGFLQQNAFHPDDTCVSMEKQMKMMQTILYLYDKAKALVTMNMPMSVLKSENIFEKVIAMKYDIPNDHLELFDEYREAIDAFYDRVLEKNA